MPNPIRKYELTFKRVILVGSCVEYNFRDLVNKDIKDGEHISLSRTNFREELLRRHPVFTWV